MDIVSKGTVQMHESPRVQTKNQLTINSKKKTKSLFLKECDKKSNIEANIM